MRTVPGRRPGVSAAGQAGTSCRTARGSVSRRVSFTECGLTECAVNVSCGRNGCRRATGALNSRCDDSCDASGRLRQATDLRRQRAKVNATPLSGRPRLRRRPRDPGVESAGSTMAARALDGVAYLLHLYARRLVQPLKAVPIICRFPQCAKKLPPLQAPPSGWSRSTPNMPANAWTITCCGCAKACPRRTSIRRSAAARCG